MFNIKKLLFGGAPNENLPADVKAAISAWQDMPVSDLESSHHLTRYVIVDIATTGSNPEHDRLTGIAATVMYQGVASPAQSIFIDLTASTAEDVAVDRQLAAFLQFIGKSPLVAYHVVLVRSFLEQLLRARLGIDFAPRWVDLAWLLPAMFSEKSHRPQPLDEWLTAFGLALGEGRRSPSENNFLLARLLQMLVVRAHAKGVNTVDQLIEESRASSELRRVR